MCDGWTSISRPQPFSQSALLLWASDALRHPGCSQFTCLCVKISGRVGLNSSRETDLENTGGHTLRWVPPQMSASWTLTSHIQNITTRRFTHATNYVTSFLLSPLCLYLYHTVNPSIGTVLLLAHSDTHLSMKEFILLANHSRGVVIKYRCANILTTLMSSAGVIWSKTWKFKYTQEKKCVHWSRSPPFPLSLK